MKGFLEGWVGFRKDEGGFRKDKGGFLSYRNGQLSGASLGDNGGAVRLMTCRAARTGSVAFGGERFVNK